MLVRQTLHQFLCFNQILASSPRTPTAADHYHLQTIGPERWLLRWRRLETRRRGRHETRRSRRTGQRAPRYLSPVFPVPDFKEMRIPLPQRIHLVHPKSKRHCTEQLADELRVIVL
jgi:hypothetical protein